MKNNRLNLVFIVLLLLLVLVYVIINADLRVQEGNASILFYKLSVNYNWLVQSLSSGDSATEDIVGIASRHRAVNLEAAGVLLRSGKQDLLQGLEQIWPHGDDLAFADKRMTELEVLIRRYGGKGPYLSARQFEKLCVLLIEKHLNVKP